MANILRIKRNTTNSNDPTISQLKGGELAYNDLTDKLFIGKGESGGHASTVELIGGKGAFVTLATAQTISGAKSFVNNAVNFCYGINIRDLGDTSTLGTISGNSTQVRLESKVEDLRLVNNNGASRLVISDVRSPSTGSLLLGADGCANLQVQSSSPGLVVTQLGSGLALQINDSSNDTTPFVITGGGYVGFGTDTPEKQVDIRNGNMQIKYDTANALGALIQLKKGRGSATAPAIVLAGDTLGTLSFSAYGESAGYAGGVTIEAKVASGQTVSPTSLPTNLVFSTTPNGSVAPVAAMTIGHDKVITVAGRITGLSTPTQDTDAATKAYVDAARAGLDVKGSCRVASTAAISFGAGNENSIGGAPLVVDGVTLEAGDRVLVKDQASQIYNGIWQVTTPGTGSNGTWTRPSDFNGSATVTGGAFTFVTEGTANADSGWVLTTNDTIVWGTTGLTFAQFSGAGQITAGAGLTKNGNTLDINVGSGANSAGLEIASDQLKVKLGAHLAFNGTTGAVDVQTGTSGNAIPLLSQGNTWTGSQQFRHNGTYFGVPTSNSYIEIWTGGANFPLLDFHCSNTDVDYNARLSVSGSTSGVGAASVTFECGAFASTGYVNAPRYISTIATGTQPLQVTSTTVCTNLNADLLDGYHVGTSGSTIPLLNAANTWEATQSFTGGATFDGATIDCGTY